MKSTSIFSNMALVIWVMAHLIFYGFASLFLYAIMGLGFMEMHTSGTAMDPMDDLTRDTVIWNIVDATLRYLIVVPVAAIIVYFISDVVWKELGKTSKRLALFLSLLCAMMLLGAMVSAGIQCFLKYPQR